MIAQAPHVPWSSHIKWRLGMHAGIVLQRDPSTAFTYVYFHVFNQEGIEVFTYIVYYILGVLENLHLQYP